MLSRLTWVSKKSVELLVVMLIVALGWPQPGMATNVPAHAGGCDDGLACTVNDTLQGGICVGSLIGDVDVRVQLSPNMVIGPVDRCITFAFYSDCANQAVQCSATIAFGSPSPPGMGTGTISVGAGCPIDRVFAVTGQDRLHTLRANGRIECNGDNLLVVFEGDPAEGGNWLIGGNLDAWNPLTSASRANTINILDFGVFIGQRRIHASYPNGDTTCNTAGPHADINGDGLVDALDYAFISGNFASVSDSLACSPALMYGAPILEISVHELYEQGLGDLVVADLKQDGRLNVDDMVAFEQGGLNRLWNEDRHHPDVSEQRMPRAATRLRGKVPR